MIQSEGGSIPEVSKAAFCKARKKLKPQAFEALSNIVTGKFYESNKVQYWNRHQLIGLGASTAELHNSKTYRIITEYSTTVTMARRFAWAEC